VGDATSRGSASWILSLTRFPQVTSNIDPFPFTFHGRWSVSLDGDFPLSTFILIKPESTTDQISEKLVNTA
jgi:hypothetical protein